MLLRILLLTATTGLPAIGWAQIAGRGLTAPTSLEYVGRELGKGAGARRSVNAIGTPFLLPNWTKGSVKTYQGQAPRTWLKYDLNSGILMWRRPSGDSLELDTERISEFTLGDSLRGSQTTFRRYPEARLETPAANTAFFEVRYDAGRSALLRQRTKNLSQSSTSPSLTDSRPISWQESSRYFIKRPDNVVLPLRQLNAKGILQAVEPAKAESLAAFAKQERLALGKEADVVKLLRYYDTL